jgi:hypothetical protein
LSSISTHTVNMLQDTQTRFTPALPIVDGRVYRAPYFAVPLLCTPFPVPGLWGPRPIRGPAIALRGWDGPPSGLLRDVQCPDGHRLSIPL